MPLPILAAALIAAPAPPPTDLGQAELTLIDHWDRTGSVRDLPLPSVRKRDLPALQWLAAGLDEAPPRNPFPLRHPSHAEAEAIRGLWQGGPLPGTAPLLTGSQFALWRWGRDLARRGTHPARTAWEDLLLQPGFHPLVREAGLRHALAFALSARDEARVLRLKAAYGAEAPEAFRPFLAALGTLGGPLPLIRVWMLPDLAPLPLGDALGPSRRIWIAPAPEGLVPPLPPDVIWLLPTVQGLAPANEELLDDASRTEGELLAARLRATGIRAALAPSRASLEKAGLVHFPALVELDAQGHIQRILLAEACLAEGHSATLGPRPH